MKQIAIQDLTPTLIEGVAVQMPESIVPYRETYFEWTGSSLVAQFARSDVSGGVLRSWRHTPVFSEIETHVDAEMFYFISGVAIMLFVDVKDGKPALETAQAVRIQPGTQIIISAGKGHFVAVAEGNDPVEIVVVSPKMDAPRMCLSETVEAIA